MKKIKYFFEFLTIISLFSIFKLIGLRNASNLGSLLGKLFGPFFRSEKIIKKNIKLALGNISYEEEKNIIGSMWSNFGRTFAEYTYLKKFRSNNNYLNQIEINGKNILEKIKNSNKPVVFFSGHFANFELMAMQLDKFGIKLAAIYRPLNNIFLNPIMEYLRIKYICPNQIPKGKSGTRQIINKIREGYNIALMVDQRVSEGVRVNFFNHPAFTTTIPAQLAMKYDCNLVPIFLERKGNLNFEMTILEPINIRKTDNLKEDVKNISLKINKELEKMILKNPYQWIWSHNRWK